MKTTRILIAPNAFKNSINAGGAALAIEKGFQLSDLNCICECFPIGDGGDGTADLIIKKCNGQRVYTQVCDPLGRKINASFGLIDNGYTAVIEMADSSGLRLLRHDELNPLIASSYGTGELIKVALDNGVENIVLGMGGSATVDGGSHILKALGIRFLDDNGVELSGMPKSLVNLRAIDLSGIDKRIFDCDLTILCDVDNLLLGKNGSAEVFGPQKGASPKAVNELDAALKKFSEIAFEQTGKDMSAIKYGGTAGGAAAGLYAFLNANLVNGIDHFLKLTNFIDALQRNDLVITGEGSMDEQTLQGKGPFGVAKQAKTKGLPVIGLAGKVSLLDDGKLSEYFNVLLSIGNEPVDLPLAMKNTAENLTRTSRQLGNLLAAAEKL